MKKTNEKLYKLAVFAKEKARAYAEECWMDNGNPATISFETPIEKRCVIGIYNRGSNGGKEFFQQIDTRSAMRLVAKVIAREIA